MWARSRQCRFGKRKFAVFERNDLRVSAIKCQLILVCCLLSLFVYESGPPRGRFLCVHYRQNPAGSKPENFSGRLTSPASDISFPCPSGVGPRTD